MVEHPASEQELAELLRRAAPQQLPPAGFDHTSVLAAAHRADARRRRVVAGGVAAAVVVLGGGVAVAGLGSDPSSTATASSAVAGSEGASTGSGPEAVAPEQRPPDRLPEAPAPAAGAPGLAPELLGTGTCGPVDRAVHAALVQVFPGLAAQQPYPVDAECTVGTSGAGVLLTADGMVGRLEVLVGPAAVVSPDATGTATTADGRTVTVVSVPAEGAAAGPLAGTLDDVARRVAAALG